MGRPRTCECGTCQKCKHREYMLGWYQRNAEQARANARATRNRNIDVHRERDRERGFRPGDPAKRAARKAVNNALKRGDLTRQPCESCGATPVDAHHDDYSKPLDVRWLCSVHHGIEHRLYA